MFRKTKYNIRYYHSFNNPPFNDVYFTLGKPGGLAKNKMELMKIWTKEENLKSLINKPYLRKEDVIEACSLKGQREELSKLLR